MKQLFGIRLDYVVVALVTLCGVVAINNLSNGVAYAKTILRLYREKTPMKNLGLLQRYSDLKQPAKIALKHMRTEFNLKYLSPTKCDDDLFSEKLINFNVSFYNQQEFKGLFEELFEKKIYYFKTASASPVIIDCGGHIGISVLFFKQFYPNAKIIVFEPVSLNFNLLTKNIKDNRLQNVFAYQLALSDQEGQAVLFDAGNTAGTIKREHESFDGESKETVKTACLSRFIDEQVDLLKIDIEGCEGIVIDELIAKDKLKYIDKIIMEYHGRGYANNSLAKILGKLEENNFKYEICREGANGPILFPHSYLLMIYAFRE